MAKQEVSKRKISCPVCGTEMIHIRLWNEEVMGYGRGNPYIGWICPNSKCHSWWCDYCEAWHPYGTSCVTAMVRNVRERGAHYITKDPNWRHSESRVKGRKRNEKNQ